MVAPDKQTIEFNKIENKNIFCSEVSHDGGRSLIYFHLTLIYSSGNI